MAKRDVMDVWSALQWVVRDQKADRANNWEMFSTSGRIGTSVTGLGLEMAELGVGVDRSRSSAPDLDPDAELIWRGVELIFDMWRRGILINEVGQNVPVQMQRYMKKMQVHPVVEMIKAARDGEMPDWMPGGWASNSDWTRREVEESRLNYLLVWDILAALCRRLQGSDSLGIVIEMPSIPRSPWNARKKVEKDC